MKMIKVRSCLTVALMACAFMRADAEMTFYEYAEAVDKAAVDTGYVANENTVITFKGMYLTKVSYGALFSDYKDQDSVATRVILNDMDEKSVVFSYFTKAEGSKLVANVVTGLGQIISGTLDRPKRVYAINGQVGDYSQETGKLTGNTIKLHSGTCRTRLYGFTVSEGGELLTIFGPASRTASPAIGTWRRKSSTERTVTRAR